MKLRNLQKVKLYAISLVSDRLIYVCMFRRFAIYNLD